jgi:hypothetical protein
MAGLVSAIHDLLTVPQDVDARHKAGHDEVKNVIVDKSRLSRNEKGRPIGPALVSCSAASVRTSPA